MATVVDALTVTLSLDNASFKAAQQQTREQLDATRQASARAAKEMQASGAQAAQFFSQIKTEALSLLGIFLGGKGIENFVRDTTKSLADLGRAAQNIGISPSDLNAFTAAMERMGGSAQSVMASLEGIARAQQQWKTFGNNPEFNAFLSLIGAGPNMKPLDIVGRFSDYAKVQQTQPGGVQRVQQTGAGIGLDVATINSILQLTKSSTLSEQMAISREYIDVTQKVVDEFAHFQTSLTALKQSMDGLATKILIPLVPSLDNLASKLAASIAHAPEQLKAAQDALERQREFDQRNIPPPTGVNKTINDWMSGSGGSVTGSDWWSYLFGNDMQNDRNRAGNLGIPPSLNRGGPRSGAYPGASPERDKAAGESFSFWTRKGLTPAQAAGMVAQEMAESGGNPGARGDYVNGQPTAIGAYQWHKDRRAQILAKTGIDVSTATIQQQREAAYWELMNVEHEARRRLLAATTPEQAGMAATEFERPDPNRRLVIDWERGRDAGNLLRRMAPNGIPRPGPRFGPPGLRPGDTPALDGPGPATIHDPAAFIGPNRAGPRVQNEDNSTAVTIGNINIHTQATDAKGVAGTLRDEIANIGNRGLN